MVHVIRRANHKTYREIHQEIRSVQATPVPPSKGFAPWVLFFMRLPGPIPKLFGALLSAAHRHDPTVKGALAGTFFVTCQI